MIYICYLSSFEKFDNDHLYAFNFVDRFGKKIDILIEDIDSSIKTDAVKLIKLHGAAPKQYQDYDEEW